MKKVFVVLFFVCSLFVSASAKFVAVLETVADSATLLVTGKISQDECRYLTDVFRSQAVASLPAELNFTIMTRENINVMLPPGKSITECEGSCLAETGRNIAADYVAQARIVKVGTSLALSAEMYETAGNKLLASFNGLGENFNDLVGLIKEQSPNFFKKVKATGGWGNNSSGFGNFGANEDFSFQVAKEHIVNVETNPTGAMVAVDGKPKCSKTPCSVQLEEGEHLFVVSLDRYEDEEFKGTVKENGQKISRDLRPKFGYLKIDPQLPSADLQRELEIEVDGIPFGRELRDIDAGLHKVSISHRCYDPINFEVLIAKRDTVVFDSLMKVGVAGLQLTVAYDDEPQRVAVFVDGKKVGETPYAGTIPVCSKVAVAEENENGEILWTEDVDVFLTWHQVAKYEHSLYHKTAEVIRMEEERRSAEEKRLAEERRQAEIRRLDEERRRLEEARRLEELRKQEEARRLAEELRKQEEARLAEEQRRTIEEARLREEELARQAAEEARQRTATRRAVVAGITVPVVIAGGVLAAVGEVYAKKYSEKDFETVQKHKKNKDEIHKYQMMRTIGIGVGIAGALGLGLNIIF